MRAFTKKYEAAKKRSIECMKYGQISAYFAALTEMNTYKKLLIAVVAN
jgi:hypothetical protein